METDISEKSEPSQGVVQRNRVVTFLARHRFAVGLTVIALVLTVYLMTVYGMAVRADRISLSLEGIVERRIMPVFEKEIPLGGSVEGCNYFTLQKCIAFNVAEEVHQKPEAFVGLLNIINDPCQILASPELDELVRAHTSDLVGKQLREMARIAPDMRERDRLSALQGVWGVRRYFDCDQEPAYDRPTKKFVLNVMRGMAQPPVAVKTSSSGTFYFRETSLSYRIVKYLN
jgi:hypothetical protein